MVEPSESISPRIKHLQRKNELMEIQITQIRRENLSLKHKVAQNTTHIIAQDGYIQTLRHEFKDLRDLFYRLFGKLPTSPLSDDEEPFTAYIPHVKGESDRQEMRSRQSSSAYREPVSLPPFPLEGIVEPSGHPKDRSPIYQTRYVLGDRVTSWVHDAAMQHCIATGQRGTVACLSLRNIARFRDATGCKDVVDDTLGILTLQTDEKLGEYEIVIFSTNEVNTGNQQQTIIARAGA